MRYFVFYFYCRLCCCIVGLFSFDMQVFLYMFVIIYDVRLIIIVGYWDNSL